MHTWEKIKEWLEPLRMRWSVHQLHKDVEGGFRMLRVRNPVGPANQLFRQMASYDGEEAAVAAFKVVVLQAMKQEKLITLIPFIRASSETTSVRFRREAAQFLHGIALFRHGSLAGWEEPLIGWWRTESDGRSEGARAWIGTALHYHLYCAPATLFSLSSLERWEAMLAAPFPDTATRPSLALQVERLTSAAIFLQDCARKKAELAKAKDGELLAGETIKHPVPTSIPVYRAIPMRSRTFAGK